MNITSIILTSLAVLIFGAGAYFSYENSETLKDIRSLNSSEDQKVNTLYAENQQLLKDEAANNDELKGLIADTEEAKEKFLEASDDLRNQESINTSIQSEIDSTESIIAENRKEIGRYDGIERIVTDLQNRREQLKALKNDIQKAEIDLSNQESLAQSKQDQSSKAFEALNDLRTGVIEPGYSARVSSSSPQQGFVVISGGYMQNIAPGAVFSLTRGGQQIAMGKVSSVSANQAVVSLDSKYTKTSVSAGDSAVYVPR